MNSINIFIWSLFLISSFAAKTNFQPKALILPVTKYQAPIQYVTRIHQRTPLVPLRLTLDLGGQFMWVNCDTHYVSKTYHPAQCGSPQCSLAKSRSCSYWCPGAPKPGCNNNTCSLMPDNFVARAATLGDLGSDLVAIQSTDGNNPGHRFTVPDFLFACQSSAFGLASGVVGMAGLGRTSISLPSQFSSAFRLRRTFAICLSPSSNSPGAVFFGDGPYRFSLNMIDVSSNLTYTPLIKNPVNTPSPWTQGVASSEYFIGVTSVRVNDKIVPVNKTLLTINREGGGGTKISTVHPYTELERSIYKAVIEAFGDALSGVARVEPVLPFGLCLNSTGIGSTRVGPGVPRIDLVLQNDDVLWRMFGANSMVEVSEDVLCLGFVDGGVSPMSSIVIGGHQIEDNLLQFDLARSRLGFSSSLLFRQTTCANFNFTSNT